MKRFQRQVTLSVGMYSHWNRISMRTGFILVVSLVVILDVCDAAPKFSKGVSVNGVISYQDSTKPTEFWYYPASIPLILGQTLEQFRVSYWGVSRPYLVEEPGGELKSVIGAILSGKINLKITETQRTELVQEIRTTFGIQDPKLVPMSISEPKCPANQPACQLPPMVQPVLAMNTLGLASGDVIFPLVVQLGTSFDYSVGASDNRVFAEFVATQSQASQGIVANAHFGINIVGQAEFIGDPWEADCKADLSRILMRILEQRTKPDIIGGVGFGWWRVGADQFSRVVQDLVRSKAIDCRMLGGSFDFNVHGRQILEMVKQIMTDMNALSHGRPFFRFEANTEPNEISTRNNAMGWWPWTLFVNLAYHPGHFGGPRIWEKRISYTGPVSTTIPLGMTIAVECNTATGQFFTELNEPLEPCITPEKAKRLNDRIAREGKAKNDKLQRLIERLISGDIGPDRYEAITSAYGMMTFTEDISPLRRDADLRKNVRSTGLSDDEIERRVTRHLEGG